MLMTMTMYEEMKSAMEDNQGEGSGGKGRKEDSEQSKLTPGSYRYSYKYPAQNGPNKMVAGLCKFQCKTKGVIDAV